MRSRSSFAWSSHPHTSTSSAYQAQILVISRHRHMVIYTRLSDSFTDEDDSSRGGINHSRGPNSLRKTPTTYRKREFLSFRFAPTEVPPSCLRIRDWSSLFLFFFFSIRVPRSTRELGLSISRWTRTRGGVGSLDKIDFSVYSCPFKSFHRICVCVFQELRTNNFIGNWAVDCCKYNKFFFVYNW